MSRFVQFSLVIACLLAGLGLAAAPAQQKPHYPQVDEEVFIRFNFKVENVVKVLDVPIRLLSPLIPCEPDQVVKLPAGFPEIHVQEFLPRAKLEQKVVPDERGEAPPVVTIEIRGPKITERRRLAANNPARSRMRSIIASWQYLWEPDAAKRKALFEQFETDPTREPALIITRGVKAPVRVPATDGAVHELEDLGAVVRVKAFYPHFSSDPKTGKPFNVSLKRRNPAAQVEVEEGGEKRMIWVFSRYPDFSRDPAGQSRLRVRLDCPLDAPRQVPDIVIMSPDRRSAEVWVRHAGKATSRKVEKNEDVPVPGSRYTFRVVDIAPSAELVEDYELTRAERAETVVKIRTREPEGEGETLWIVLNRERTIDARQGALHVTLRSRDKRGPAPPVPRRGKK